MKIWHLLSLFSLMGFVSSDTPADCPYEDIRGEWVFYLDEGGRDNRLDCTTSPFETNAEYRVKLLFPNVAVDDFGQEGKWTMIYNQGFEVTIGGRKFFAFSKFIPPEDGKDAISVCQETSPGWYHEENGQNWGCYFGVKQVHASTNALKITPVIEIPDQPLVADHDIVERINQAQSSWTAGVYDEDVGKSLRLLHRRAGPLKAHVPPSQISQLFPMRVKASRQLKNSKSTINLPVENAPYVNGLPKNFDWRNVNGVSYVSPVRNQGHCGSCYTYSATGMIEARIRIMTNNALQPVLSTQEIVSCSPYTQGCEGGFPYLTAGKYGKDFGMIEESCYPYEGQNTPCQRKCENPQRYYTSDYQYVGGFYGACNDDLMMLELLEHGPMAVSFEVFPDFHFYKGGIYVHTGLQSNYNPFETCNHAVLLVGYGEDEASGEKYWIIKNSWGEEWGEKGYFRIRRGTDEAAIESIAVSAIPKIPDEYLIKTSQSKPAVREDHKNNQYPVISKISQL